MKLSFFFIHSAPLQNSQTDRHYILNERANSTLCYLDRLHCIYTRTLRRPPTREH